jgi:membrane protein DedA with SNARE-associated domain
VIPYDTLIDWLTQYGLWIVAFAATAEGPIVTVLSAFLAREGVFPLVPLAIILVAGDILGDLGFYLLGRRGIGRVPMRWRRRFGLGPGRTEALVEHFARRGGRLLVLGKLTHSVGAAVLVAAGVARMRLVPFLAWNLVASLPKTGALMALGWVAGDAYAQIDMWLGRGAWVMLGLIALAVAIWLFRRRPCTGN